MIEHIHPDGEPTPTVAELYERRDGSAEVAQWTAGSKDGKTPPKPAVYLLTAKGYAVLGEIMRRNAAATLARGTARTEAVESVRRFARSAEQEQERKTRKGKSSGRKSTWTPS